MAHDGDGYQNKYRSSQFGSCKLMKSYTTSSLERTYIYWK